MGRIAVAAGCVVAILIGGFLNLHYIVSLCDEMLNIIDQSLEQVARTGSDDADALVAHLQSSDGGRHERAGASARLAGALSTAGGEEDFGDQLHTGAEMLSSDAYLFLSPLTTSRSESGPVVEQADHRVHVRTARGSHVALRSPATS